MNLTNGPRNRQSWMVISVYLVDPWRIGVRIILNWL
jgi:hypothetical protein